MQLQQGIPNATKKSQLPGLKHSALAVPSSQAEDFSASRLKKYLFEREYPYNRHDSGSKDRGLIFRQGCFAVPQTINVQMMSVECKEESKGRGWWGKFPLCLCLCLCLCLVYISLQRKSKGRGWWGKSRDGFDPFNNILRCSQPGKASSSLNSQDRKSSVH